MTALLEHWGVVEPGGAGEVKTAFGQSTQSLGWKMTDGQARGSGIQQDLKVTGYNTHELS